MISSNKYQNLYRSLLSLQTPKETEQFLMDLMTPQEIANIADRFEVAGQLAEGKTQRQVSADTNVALATVTRVNRFLKYGYDGYKLILDRLSSSKQHVHPRLEGKNA